MQEEKPSQNSAGFGVACAAIEVLGRQLAVELGKFNIRVVCLRSAGSPDAIGVSRVFDDHAAARGQTREVLEQHFVEQTMLKHLPSLAEVANVAAIIASEKATAVTAAIVNVTCGELAD